jgi:hypothetical protein
MILYIFCIVCIILASIPYTSGTIFTCTTFFDFKKQDRWRTFCRAIDSITRYHTPETLNKITRWIVINEYSENSKDWASICKKRYPWIELIQKDSSQKGQPASMNIILDTIQPYKYWIHWEETWFLRCSCFDRMFSIMETTHITQLQITQLDKIPNWLNKPHVCYSNYCIIKREKNTFKYLNKSPYTMTSDFWTYWPHYSLLPSINRVCDYKTLGYFSTDPNLWPLKFEWDYARRWFSLGNIKGVLPDGPCIRNNSEHKSTYD